MLIECSWFVTKEQWVTCCGGSTPRAPMHCELLHLLATGTPGHWTGGDGCCVGLLATGTPGHKDADKDATCLSLQMLEK
jgi:hypothetical protein